MKHKRILTAAMCLCLAATNMGVLAVQAESTLLGDVSGNGTIEVIDVLQLQKWLLGADAGDIVLSNADMNNDGDVDVFDLALVKREVLKINPDADFSAIELSKSYHSAAVTGQEADDAFILGQTAFALSLLQNTIEDENILVSPYSVVQALGMTANGAVGQTKKEMEQVIGGMTMEELNAYLYTQRTNQPNMEKCKLTTANSIWFRDTEKLTIQPEFLQTNADYYDADAFKAPFDDTTVKDINNWVNTNTDGMIPKLLGKEIDEEVMLYLMNAVAFDAKWKHPYWKDTQLKTRQFTAYDGTTQTAELLFSDEDYYLKDDHATGFLKYYAGDRYAFAVLLPEEGLSVTDYIAGLTAESLHETLSTSEHTPVYAGLPKFSYDYDIELNAPLAAMGMPTAFHWWEADFSAMGKTEDGGLYIGKVMHKTHIDVFEDGTRAAALTVVEMEPPTMPPEPEYTVILNRPFVYCIVDTETALPVFIGALMEIPE